MTLKVEFIATPELEAETGEHSVLEECEVVAVWVFAALVSALLGTRHVHHIACHVSAATKVPSTDLIVVGPGGVLGRRWGGVETRFGGLEKGLVLTETSMIRCHAYRVGGLDKGEDGDHHRLNLTSLAKHDVDGRTKETGIVCC